MVGRQHRVVDQEGVADRRVRLGYTTYPPFVHVVPLGVKAAASARSNYLNRNTFEQSGSGFGPAKQDEVASADRNIGRHTKLA